MSNKKKSVKEILTFLITKKTMEELEEEQRIIQERIKKIADLPQITVIKKTSDSLEVKNGILAAAILSKKFGK